MGDSSPTSAPHGYAAVIGDVVGSRRAARPDQLRQQLRDALAAASDRIEALQPPQMTIGDEFQGVYQRLGQALNATLLLRLLLHGVTDLRFGVGWGAFTAWVPDAAPYEQDGPAWWAAREALETARAQERRSGTPAGWRTAVRILGETPSGAPAPDRQPAPGQDLLFRADQYLVDSAPLDLDVNLTLEALVMFRDHVAHTLDGRDVALVLDLMEGATVSEAAERAGISQQAASRRLRTNGGYSILRSWEILELTG